MALVDGTNCGFVLSAPVADPAGTATTRDNYASAIKVVAPAGISAITEIDWWSDNYSNETNFEVGLYSHDAGNDKPGTQLEIENINAKGTALGWKTVSVNWSVTPETTYWIALQIDNTATTTKFDWSATGGLRISVRAASSLGATWPVDSNEGPDYLYSIYALYEVVSNDISGTIDGIGAISGALTFDTTGLIGNAAGVSSESGILTFASLGLTGSVAGAGGGSGILSFEALAITGTIAAVAALSGGMLFGNIIKPSTTVTVNRLIVAGNDQIWYESI